MSDYVPNDNYVASDSATIRFRCVTHLYCNKSIEQ